MKCKDCEHFKEYGSDVEMGSMTLFCGSNTFYCELTGEDISIDSMCH
jgi:hypothetical protein